MHADEGVLLELLEANNLRLLFGAGNLAADIAREAREDTEFLAHARRALLPLPLIDRDPEPPATIFPPFAPFRVPALAGKRIGLVASGGSGALASLCGFRRAFEEAGLEVAAISACSGAMFFASLWASGMSANQMGRFWLDIKTNDYVDVDWGEVGRAALRRFRDFAGLLRGDAIERTFRRQLGDAEMGQLRTPLHAVVWNIDRNAVEYLGTRTTPDLAVARVVRAAVSIPLFVEPVRIGEHLYGDGGVVSIFPVRPLLEHEEPLDVVLGVNCYFPENFLGEDIGRWRERTWAIFRASRQLRTCVTLELAREEARLLGARLTMLHPVPYTEIDGAKLYDTFLDRSKWPWFMRRGHQCAREALMQLGAGYPVTRMTAMSSSVAPP